MGEKPFYIYKYVLYTGNVKSGKIAVIALRSKVEMRELALFTSTGKAMT